MCVLYKVCITSAVTLTIVVDGMNRYVTGASLEKSLSCGKIKQNKFTVDIMDQPCIHVNRLNEALTYIHPDDCYLKGAVLVDLRKYAVEAIKEFEVPVQGAFPAPQPIQIAEAVELEVQDEVVTPFSGLVTVSNDELVTSTLAIAEGTELDHASVIKLVRTYVKDLEEFGLLDFKSESSGGRPTEFALLNEQQATLLITYMRNNSIVRAFKMCLVKAFYEMRSQLQNGMVSIKGALQEIKGEVSAGFTRIESLMVANHKIVTDKQESLATEQAAQAKDIADLKVLAGVAFSAPKPAPAKVEAPPAPAKSVQMPVPVVPSRRPIMPTVHKSAYQMALATIETFLTDRLTVTWDSTHTAFPTLEHNLFHKVMTYLKDGNVIRIVGNTRATKYILIV